MQLSGLLLDGLLWERLGEGCRDEGMQIRISFICSRSTTAGAEITVLHLYKVGIVSQHVGSCFNGSVGSFTFAFQLFQLTALAVCAPVTFRENFFLNLDRVPIEEEEVRGALICVQDIVPSPQALSRIWGHDAVRRCCHF